jgi:hypothetical protein
MEMQGHTSKIQGAIDDGRNDDAWRLVHKFQEWCIERINHERYDKKAAGTILSAPQLFFVRILKADGRYKQALAHTIYEGVLDGRNLKVYPKNIKALFKKCGFKETSLLVALNYYEELRMQPFGLDQDFKAVLIEVDGWK